MTEHRLKNVAASVRQRLLNRSRARGEDYQKVLIQYAAERLLYRLARSLHSHRFVLKGATLFSLWSDAPHRPTRDLDLWSHGESSIGALEECFREICATLVDDDGIVFAPDTVRGSEIRIEDEYLGVRLRFQANLGGARIPMQVDVGFGDDIQPQPTTVRFPSLLDLPEPELRVYPREAVVAENDRFLLHLSHVVTQGLGDRAGTCIDPRIQLVQGRPVCLVSCQRSPEPVFLKWKKLEASPEGDFFVRTGAQTKKLAPASVAQYIRTRFRQAGTGEPSTG